MMRKMMEKAKAALSSVTNLNWNAVLSAAVTGLTKAVADVVKDFGKGQILIGQALMK